MAVGLRVSVGVGLLGALIYLIARGRSMTERQMAELADRQAQQQRYIKEAAGTATQADQILSARGPLDSGAITQAEFEAIKAKALAQPVTWGSNVTRPEGGASTGPWWAGGLFPRHRRGHVRTRVAFAAAPW